MSSIIYYRIAWMAWFAYALLAVAHSPLAQAKTIDPALAEKIYKAIEKAQTDDPDSYLSTFDYQMPSASSHTVIDDPASAHSKDNPLASNSCSGLPTHGKVYGSAMLEGEVLDYEIDFYDLVVHATYQGETHVLPAKALVDFQSKEGWPCAVPVAAVICAISGGAFCGWRISQCYKAAENCRCGVAVYNCGVCGEGSGVQCRACDLPRPDLPDLEPLFPWPITWGY